MSSSHNPVLTSFRKFLKKERKKVPNDILEAFLMLPYNEEKIRDFIAFYKEKNQSFKPRRLGSKERKQYRYSWQCGYSNPSKLSKRERRHSLKCMIKLEKKDWRDVFKGLVGRSNLSKYISSEESHAFREDADWLREKFE
jgi:hypothetical protein